MMIENKAIGVGGKCYRLSFDGVWMLQKYDSLKGKYNNVKEIEDMAKAIKLLESRSMMALEELIRE